MKTLMAGGFLDSMVIYSLKEACMLNSLIVAITAKLRAFVEAEAPEGYEDTTGFHFGLPNSSTLSGQSTMNVVPSHSDDAATSPCAMNCVWTLHLEDSSAAALIVKALEEGGLSCAMDISDLQAPPILWVGRPSC
jgi:hypothetical protein